MVENIFFKRTIKMNWSVWMKKSEWRIDAGRVSILVLVSKICMYWNEWRIVIACVSEWLNLHMIFIFADISPPPTCQIRATNDVKRKKNNMVWVCKKEAPWCREQWNLQTKQKIKRAWNKCRHIGKKVWNAHRNIFWNKIDLFSELNESQIHFNAK